MKHYSKLNVYKILNRSSFRFILSTILNFMISFFPYLFLIYIGTHYFVAYLVSFILLLMSSNLLHIKFSFLSSLTLKRISIYSIYYTLYFCMGCLIIWYSIEFIKLTSYLAPLLNILLLPVHYFVSKFIIEKN